MGKVRTMFVGDRVKGPQRWPHANSCSLWLCYLTQQMAPRLLPADLSGELLLGYPSGPSVSTRVLKWGRVGAREMAGWKLNCCCWLWRWRRKGPGIKGFKWPLEAENGRTDTLLVPPDRIQPSGTLVSAWWGPFLLSGLPNCTLLKATKLWLSVTAATEN